VAAARHDVPVTLTARKRSAKMTLPPRRRRVAGEQG